MFQSLPYRFRWDTTDRVYRFVPDLVLLQHGEADSRAGTSGSEDRARFSKPVAVFRNNGVGVRIVAALSTGRRSEANQPMFDALIEMATEDLSIRVEPDTDRLAGALRYDGCQFSVAGLEAAGELWVSLITSSVIYTSFKVLQSPSELELLRRRCCGDTRGG
ncbi:MAG: hypothetical protein IPO82_05870 [Betaproteobacteria bacterium]|nr:hypothetical protein [Betaproteobacteria bacterium]